MNIYTHYLMLTVIDSILMGDLVVHDLCKGQRFLHTHYMVCVISGVVWCGVADALKWEADLNLCMTVKIAQAFCVKKPGLLALTVTVNKSHSTYVLATWHSQNWSRSLQTKLFSKHRLLLGPRFSVADERTSSAAQQSHTNPSNILCFKPDISNKKHTHPCCKNVLHLPKPKPKATIQLWQQVLIASEHQDFQKICWQTTVAIVTTGVHQNFRISK